MSLWDNVSGSYCVAYTLKIQYMNTHPLLSGNNNHLMNNMDNTSCELEHLEMELSIHYQCNSSFHKKNNVERIGLDKK
jgi:hypothetical protein